MLIQAFLPKPAVEAFYKRVVCRRAASGKIQLHGVLISPTIHYLSGELATVVHLYSAWRSSLGCEPCHCLGYMFAKPAFDALRRKIDPRRVNGGLFLGLGGIVIKSHGGTDAEGFAGAVDIGHDMVRHRLLDKIRETLALSQEHRDSLPERGDAQKT